MILLKTYKKNFLILLFSSLIFAVVFYLYNLPITAVLYAFLLCLLMLSSLISFEYLQYSKKSKIFKAIENNILMSIDLLPNPVGVTEVQYHKLLNELFREYKLLASSADTSKTDMIDFYTLWVHQIKTPISAISLLLQTDDIPQNKAIAQELFKIEQYTQLVLGYLRIDNISSDLILKECNIDTIINKAVKKYAPVFINKKIKIDISNCNKTVITDEKWLLFVIEQLLSNSLKYTNSGTIKIEMIHDNLIIKDTGIGIGENDLPRIFEKSFTGLNGRLNSSSTGLGLYLCKKTLIKLNHNISITSKLGVGTDVTINLAQSDIRF